MEREMLARQQEEEEQRKREEDGSVLPWNRRAGRRRNHSISRVVVKHRDSFETYSSNGATSLKVKPNPLLPSFQPRDNNDFFDTDSFWSGSITWY